MTDCLVCLWSWWSEISPLDLNPLLDYERSQLIEGDQLPVSLGGWGGDVLKFQSGNESGVFWVDGCIVPAP